MQEFTVVMMGDIYGSELIHFPLQLVTNFSVMLARGSVEEEPQAEPEAKKK